MSAPEIIPSPMATTAVAIVNETASMAVASQARAQVEARYVIAYKNRRHFDKVRTSLLLACRRTLFARAAIYAKPLGTKDEKGKAQFAEGPSIRFAEEAARALGNLLCENIVVYDDPSKRIVRYSVTDLETNLSYYLDRTIEKTVERKWLKKGQTALSSRLNSYGDVVHLIPATDDQLATKEAAISSKTLRELILRHLPSDIREECLGEIEKTLQSDEVKDPGAERKRVVDSFMKVGVNPVHLEEYLGHDLDVVSPSELKQLRVLWAGIESGETTWVEVMDEKEQDKPAEKAAADGGKPKTLNDAAAKAKEMREGLIKHEKPAVAEKAAEPKDVQDELPEMDPKKVKIATLRTLCKETNFKEADLAKMYKQKTLEEMADSQIDAAIIQVTTIKNG